jgi:hypothetical protein
MILSDQPSRIASRSIVRHVELYFSLMESIWFLIACGRATTGRLDNGVIPPFGWDTEKPVSYVVVKIDGTYTCGLVALLGHCLFCYCRRSYNVRTHVRCLPVVRYSKMNRLA